MLVGVERVDEWVRGGEVRCGETGSVAVKEAAGAEGSVLCRTGRTGNGIDDIRGVSVQKAGVVVVRAGGVVAGLLHEGRASDVDSLERGLAGCVLARMACENESLHGGREINIGHDYTTASSMPYTTCRLGVVIAAKYVACLPASLFPPCSASCPTISLATPAPLLGRNNNGDLQVPITLGRLEAFDLSIAVHA